MRTSGLALILLVVLSLTAGGGEEGSSPSSGPPEASFLAGTTGDVANRTTDTTNGPASSEVDRAPANAAARCYVDAVNTEDLDALVCCFAPNGVVVDVSRSIEGPDAIRGWAGNEVMGGSLRVLEEEPRPNGTRLLVHWAPVGSDGWRAYYAFEVQEGRIVVADLQYA